jgi:hypothetical protein
MMFWICNNRRWIQPITPSAPAGAGFDATYDALVNALTAGGAKGVIAIPYKYSSVFHFVAANPVPEGTSCSIEPFVSRIECYFGICESACSVSGFDC